MQNAVKCCCKNAPDENEVLERSLMEAGGENVTGQTRDIPNRYWNRFVRKALSVEMGELKQAGD